MAQVVTFKNIHPTATLTIGVSPGNPGAPSVDIAPNASQEFDLNLNDALTQLDLRHFLHAGALVVTQTRRELLPTDIPGLEWWIRPDRSAITLTALVQWDDQSGAGDPNRNAIDADGDADDAGTVVPNDPDFNGQQTIHFDHQALSLAGLWDNAPVNQPFTIIIIGKDDGQDDNHRPWIGDVNQNEWYQATFGLPPSFAGPSFFGSSAPNPVPNDIELNSTVRDTGQPVFYVTEFNDPNSSTIRINSTLPQPTTQHGGSGTADTGINPLGQLAIGWAFGTGVSLLGTIAEIIVVRGILPQATMNALGAYVKNRYNLPIVGPLAPPIDPSDLPNLQLWLRGDLGVHAHVTHIDDQSGAGDPNRDVDNAGTLTTQPVLHPADPLLNGAPSLQMDGTQFIDMVGAFSGGPLAQPITLVVVGYDGALGVENFIGYKTGNNWVMTTEGGFYGIDIAFGFDGTTPDSTTPKILYFEYNDPNTTLRVSADTAERTGDANAGALPALELGGNTQGQRTLHGAIAEVIAFNRILTNDERTGLQAYLSDRYNIVVGP